MRRRETQAKEAIESSFLMEARGKRAMAETATKTAVQVPWSEIALRAVLMVMRAEEVEVTQPANGEMKKR
jgi:hypothetical protein